MSENVTGDVNSEKEKILKEVAYFQFPVENLVQQFSKISEECVLKGINKFSDQLREVYSGSEGLDDEIASGKKDTLKKFSLLIKLRGEQLRNYFDATNVFTVDSNVPLEEDYIQNDYDEEKEKVMEDRIQKLNEKQYKCYLLKNKLEELDALNATADELLAKTEK